MKKSLYTTTLLTLVAGVACAQSNNTSSGFTLRGGYSYLANSDSRSAVSSSGYTAGLSYDLPSMAKYMGGGGKISLDVDYSRASGNSNEADSTAYQLAFRTAAGNAKGGMNPYFGLSGGYFQNHYNVGGNTGTKGVFGGSVIVGINITQQVGFEASYRFSGTVDGANFDTINGEITFHF